MKFLKTLTVLALSAVATSLFAANVATAYLTFTADGTSYSDQVKLFEDDSDVLTGVDTYNSINDYCVNAYVVYNSANYTKVKLASLNNLVVKFKANNHNTNYTLTFSDVEGAEIKVVYGNDTTVASNTASYQFTCNVNEELTFTINPQPSNIYERKNLTVGQWGTVCLPWNMTKVDGAQALYKLTSIKDAKEVYGDIVLTSNTVAGEAYVFQAAKTTLTITYDAASEVANPVTGQSLVGTFVNATVPAGMYGISGTSIMEVKAGTALLANRAYIDLSKLTPYTPGAPGRRLFDVVGEITALDAVKAEAGKVQKVMINGQMVIIRDGKMFNAQGMEL